VTRDISRSYNIKNDVEIVGRRYVYDGYFKIEQLQIKYRMFSGDMSKLLLREVFHRGNAVGVLLYNPWNDSVLLTEQFRVGALGDQKSPWLIELVAGIIDNDEKPEDTVHRETKEESGATILSLRHICDYWVSPGGSSEFLHLYCGCIDQVKPGQFGVLSDGEDIKVSEWPLEKAIVALKDGVINNAHTIIALQWLMLNHNDLQQEWKGLKI